jgi:hypothetical protein
MNENEGWIYIFASLLAARPKYRQEAINLLALPSGFVHKLRYKTDWIALDGPVSDESLAQIKNRPVAIVFVTYEDEVGQTNPTFYPLRLGTVIDANTEAGVVFIHFAVDKYLKVDDPADMTAVIKNALGEDRPPNKFVVTGPHIPDLTGASLVEPGVGWESTVSHLASKPEFQLQGFIRVTGCRELKRETRTGIEGGALLGDPLVVGYKLQTRKQYALDVAFLSPNYGGGKQELQLQFNDSLIEALDGDLITIDTRYDSRTLRFFVKDASTSRYSAALIRSKDNPLGNAEIVVPFELQPRTFLRWALTGFMLAGLAAGAVAGGIDAGTTKVILLGIGTVIPALVIFFLTGEIKK